MQNYQQRKLDHDVNNVDISGNRIRMKKLKGKSFSNDEQECKLSMIVIRMGGFGGRGKGQSESEYITSSFSSLESDDEGED